MCDVTMFPLLRLYLLGHTSVSRCRRSGTENCCLISAGNLSAEQDRVGFQGLSKRETMFSDEVLKSS